MNPTATTTKTSSDAADDAPSRNASSNSVPRDSRASEAAIEITIRWGDSVLAVERLSPPREFVLGTTKDCDYAVPRELLGCERRSLPTEDSELELGPLHFTVRTVEREEKAKRGLGWNKRSFATVAASAVLHVGMLAATAAFMPSFGLADDDMVTEEQRYLMQHYLEAVAEQELEHHADAGTQDGNGSVDLGVQAQSQVDAERRTTQGPNVGGPGGEGRATRGVPMTAADAVADARDFGMVQLLRYVDWGNTPSPWDATRADDGFVLTNAASWHGDPLAPFAMNLSNPGGEGSDSPGNWLFQDGVRTTPGGPKGQFGDRLVRVPNNRHQPSAPSVRTAPPALSGTLPAAVIQRIVRANYGRFRACYQSGLQQNPSLAGRVAVNFVIGRDGRVSGVNGAGSDMPNSAVINCVVGSFRGLTFPAPDHGIVTVSYPIVMSPANV
jgi:hypothetical protein